MWLLLRPDLRVERLLCRRLPAHGNSECVGDRDCASRPLEPFHFRASGVAVRVTRWPVGFLVLFGCKESSVTVVTWVLSVEPSA